MNNSQSNPNSDPRCGRGNGNVTMKTQMQRNQRFLNLISGERVPHIVSQKETVRKHNGKRVRAFNAVQWFRITPLSFHGKAAQRVARKKRNK